VLDLLRRAVSENVPVGSGPYGPLPGAHSLTHFGAQRRTAMLAAAGAAVGGAGSSSFASPAVGFGAMSAPGIGFGSSRPAFAQGPPEGSLYAPPSPYGSSWGASHGSLAGGPAPPAASSAVGFKRPYEGGTLPYGVLNPTAVMSPSCCFFHGPAGHSTQACYSFKNGFFLGTSIAAFVIPPDGSSVASLGSGGATATPPPPTTSPDTRPGKRRSKKD
jgi:hypothetical protein